MNRRSGHRLPRLSILNVGAVFFLLAGGAARAAVVGPSVYKALEKSSEVRVVVTYDPGVPFDFSTPAAKAIFDAAVQAIDDDILARFLPGEFSLLRRFVSINALAGTVNLAGVLRLQTDRRVLRIDVDQGGRAHLVEARALSRIDPVLSVGFTGRGVTVAILDSGLDSQHPDLENDIVAEQCFCSGNGGCCPNRQASQSGPGSAADDNGHGTNVGGIVTSDGTTAPRGAAPDAKVVAVKVLAADNSFCCSSDVVAGLDWILNNRPDVNLVNMSLGTTDLFSGPCDNSTSYTSSYATAVNALRQRGTLVFASAGNDEAARAMAAPACVANVVSVGAVYDSNLGPESFEGICTDQTTQADQVTCFSNSDTTTARAIQANIAAINAPAGGEIVLYPGNMTLAPGTKTISFNAGQVLANNAVVGLATDGSGTMGALVRFSNGSQADQVNVAVDVFGYFDQP